MPLAGIRCKNLHQLLHTFDCHQYPTPLFRPRDLEWVEGAAALEVVEGDVVEVFRPNQVAETSLFETLVGEVAFDVQDVECHATAVDTRK
ncbi:hypothetical protein D3C76_1658070 [compost metagenome]